MLKGMEVSVEDLLPGTAVEVLDTALYPNAPKDEKGRVVGVYVASGETVDHYQMYQRATRYLPKVYFGPDYPTISATNYVTATAKPFRKLTGLTGKKLIVEAGPAITVAGLTKNPGVYSGTDPEVFAVDEKGEVIPAWLWAPEKIEGKQPAYTPFWDGVQAEFTVPASHCACFLMDNIHLGLEVMQRELKKKFPKAKLTTQSVIEVPQLLLDTAEEKYVMLGCSPSKNAYQDMGKLVGDPRSLKYRFAGGHVHLGLDKTYHPKLETYVKAIDAFAGLMSVGIFDGFDSPVRRQFYGLAGEYRQPPHGLEYRTLSNAWMAHPALAQLMFDVVRAGLWLGETKLASGLGVQEAEVKEVINATDAKAARKLVEANKTVYLAVLEWIFARSSIRGTPRATPKQQAQMVYKVIMEGAKGILAKDDDIVGNWFLGQAWETHNENGNGQWHKAAAIIAKGGKI